MELRVYARAYKRDSGSLVGRWSGWQAALRLLLGTAAIVGLSLTAAAPAAAVVGAVSSPNVRPFAVPAPPAGSAVVNVKIGADRIPGTPIAATGLAGVTLRLGPSAGDTTSWASFTWASCTSDAQGDCNFIIPLRTSGTTNTSGMLATAQPWVMQISAPAGYRLVPQLRISGDTVVNYRFQIGQTLTAGSTYSSTSSSFDFMVTSTGSSSTTTSAGYWQVARSNPVMSARCGLRYAVLMDLSSSISSTELAQAKSAVNTFVDALVGTPSSVALFNFDETSPSSSTYPNVPTLRSVRTTAEANLVKQTYAGWQTGSGTNWDAGLYAVAAAAPQYDVVVMITDGNPTDYGSVTAATGSGSNRLRDDEAGIFSANLLKAEGSRLVAIGVGPDVASGNSPLNLAAISGPTVGSDYFQTGDYNAAATALAGLAKGNCEGSIDVIKRTIPSTAVIPTSPTKAQLDALSTPASGWQINGVSTGTGVSFGSPGGPWTTQVTTGAATIPLRFPTPTASGPVTWTETQQAGYALQPVTISGAARNAVCVNANTQATVAVTDVGSGTAAPGVTLPVAVNTAIECTIYNRQLPVSLSVTKKWIVNGVTYANGSQPTGLTAQLLLTGPGAASASPQAWGVARTGYAPGSTATISETFTAGALTGCRLTSAVITAVNGQASNFPVGVGGYALTLGAGSTTNNTAEVTNTVTCEQTLSLVKRVSFGSASPSSWTLTAAGPNGSLAGPSGQYSANSAVSSPVTAAAPYILSETGGSALYQQIGDWVCAYTASPASGVPVVGGAVTVPLGRDVTCTVTNATSGITLLKKVDGGTARPADWLLTATPVSMSGLSATTVPGADEASGGNAANRFEARPGHTYTLTETQADPTAPLAYQQVRLEVRNADGSWSAVPNATITAPAAGQTAVYRFVNAPRPAFSLPLTGGTAADVFVLSGLGVIGSAVVAAALLLLRRRIRGSV